MKLPRLPSGVCAVDHATLQCDLSTDTPISAHAKASPHVLQGQPAHIPARGRGDLPDEEVGAGDDWVDPPRLSAVKMRGPPGQKSKCTTVYGTLQAL